jgi:hypothetical protein
MRTNNNNNRNQMHSKNNNNNNRFRRNNNGNGGGSNNNRNRSNNNGRYGQDEDSTFVSPQQRRHATNQQNKFLDMAKNARQTGERVEYEYYMQHVEHYTRIINLADEHLKAREDNRQQREYVSDNAEDDYRQEEYSAHDTTDSHQEQVNHSGRMDEDEAAEEPQPHNHMRRARTGRKPRIPLREKHITAHEMEGSGENNHEAAAPVEVAHDEAAPKKRRGRPKKPEQSPQFNSDSGASLQHVLPMARMDD